ncbi:MAG: DUF2344 domain-containing protein [Lachnospiraceae bacterium]|nr:DUF2344 domain-containing protein [Lachnospiraceae bacterium]
MKIRIKFRKDGIMKFIGHLDMMRYFQKALKRAQIPVCYTGGFSPHMIMSFASPLGVGLTSDGEYLDVEVESMVSCTEGVKRLNEVMPEGLEILSFRKIPEEKSQKAMSLVAAADYEVRFRLGKEPRLEPKESPLSLSEAFAGFLAQPQILVTKKSKKSQQELDIRPFIYKAQAEEDLIFLRLSAGSVTNIKPELVLEAFFQYLGQTMEPFSLLIHRRELYACPESTEKGDRLFVSLENLGSIF